MEPPIPTRYVVNQLLRKAVYLTRHAEDRFIERCQGTIEEAVGQAVKFGAQLGESFLLVYGDAAFPIEKRDGKLIATTTLTIGQAMVNMQSRGMARSMDTIEALNHESSRTANRTVAASIEHKETPLHVLAVTHVLEGHPRKRRNHDLRACGYDPGGESGRQYQCAYKAVQEVLKVMGIEFPNVAA